ncbi:Protein of unknown function (DUF2866) [Paraburkholderia caribensis MBA4]|jgi:hypothetical protein|nr:MULTISPECIES: DUF2866 domain-containing protein [Paraburkholderia]EUC13144.1 Protein of unknown function DUF2866 [Burkholderia sp. BT03]SKC87609.1 Protein of unknown function [Burkholderia sp. CF099]SOE84661.1 Protein of unknown function [Burkholderia sp. YR290]ALL68831.1 Protein of unknown function (DUF2866) [Paraburkholderia caribensis MBA4]ALP65712.1 hypothetical protein AN416_24550 [Paraburkholderia caribensis]
MVEDTVFEHLRALHGNAQTLTIRSCTVSPPMQHPWGRSFRLVEWTFRHDVESFRRVVPAESTPRQIAEAVMSHVPGRRFCQPGG